MNPTNFPHDSIGKLYDLWEIIYLPAAISLLNRAALINRNATNTHDIWIHIHSSQNETKTTTHNNNNNNIPFRRHWRIHCAPRIYIYAKLNSISFAYLFYLLRFCWLFFFYPFLVSVHHTFLFWDFALVVVDCVFFSFFSTFSNAFM